MTSTTIYGTSHFINLYQAARYYLPYGVDFQQLIAKIINGEISIGAPKLKEGERLSIIKDEGRYQIEVTN